MRVGGANGVGRFTVEFEVVNYADLIRAQDGTLPPDQVRRETIRGLVDSGSTRLVLTQDVVKRLGLPLGDPIKVRYADGRRARRARAEGVYVHLLGRHGTFTAVVEPKRETALIGAIVLEDLDLLVDCVAQRVVPRDPTGTTSEIERTGVEVLGLTGPGAGDIAPGVSGEPDGRRRDRSGVGVDEPIGSLDNLRPVVAPDPARMRVTAGISLAKSQPGR